MKNPYSVLGVEKTATEEQIRKAYRKLAKEHHPDRFSNAEDKAKHVEIFKEVNEANEILTDKNKRAEYDTYGHVGRNPFGGSKPFTNPMDDFFRSVFGGAGRRTNHGEDIVLDCHITLEDVLRGGEQTLKYSQNVLCDKCSGFGGVKVVCDLCKGSGVQLIYGAKMTVQKTCEKCFGAGHKIDSSCAECNNGFKGSIDKSINFTIPLGVENNMKFAFRGQGDPVADGANGDLFVIVRIAEDPKFLRNGHHILYSAKVWYSTLVLGGEITIPTIHGDVALKIPAGTPVGRQFKLRGQGLPVFGRANMFGDQFVEIQLKIPTNLSDEYQDLIRKISEFERD